MRTRLLILCSGNLGLSCLKELLNKGYEISGIMTDKGSVSIREFAEEKRLPIYSGNPNRIEAWSFLRATSYDIPFSINYLFLLNPETLSLFEPYVLNIHGSLLPEFRGRTPHVWAIINGEKKTGVTIHKIDHGCDTGEILLQEELEISHQDTGGSILSKFAEMYPRMIDQGIQKVVRGIATFKSQDISTGSSFPKRVPEDGAINWSWDGDRICNWVRALTKPYPGAFTISKNGQKIVVWSVEKMPLQYRETEPGTIVEGGDHPVIRNGDSLIKLKDWEYGFPRVSIGFNAGEKLN